MQYTYTYNPLEDKMTEHAEKDVLMKCTKCGYEEST